MLQVFRKSEKGFTLIELLVVIAIIGILSTIVLVSLNTARQKARDVRRVSDMRQIALGLEMYYDDENKYPGDANELLCDDWDALVTALETDYITSVPTDPVGGTTNVYAYESSSDGQRYVLKAVLEDDGHSALDNDVDGTVYACTCADTVPGYCIKP